MLLAFLILLLMPPVELRATSASAAARAEHDAAQAVSAEAPCDTSRDGGAHRAPGPVDAGEASAGGIHKL